MRPGRIQSDPGVGSAMTFEEILDRVTVMLERRKRVAYRTLKAQFNLDDDALAALRDELVYAQRVATDEDDRVLVWTGSAEGIGAPAQAASPPAPQPDRPSVALPTAPTEPRAHEPERRQLTVMFCDLVDSTSLASRLDPEDLREVIGAYQTDCAEAIERFEGHVAQYLGDGLLVYFGYPQAHEDDARRAIRAALEIVEATERLDAPQRRTGADERLAVRLGIHTGLVVVGEVGGGERHERLALGETPNLAARLQALAAPGQVVVSEATHRLAERAFRWHDLGRQNVKGFGEPQHVWQAMGEIGARPRPGLAGSPILIGRDGELSLLRQCWEQARRTDGRVVLLSGEPGIGKSRIVETFGEEAQAQPSSALHYFCSPYYQNSALFPFVA